MAIRLVVDEYCADCLDFTPEVKKPERNYVAAGEVIQTHTIVACKYAHRCEQIAKYLRKEVNKEFGEGRGLLWTIPGSSE